MQGFKQHIAVFLLAGFLLPQVVSSMHYLLVSHSFSFENQTAFSKADFSFQYHPCQYHLNNFSSVLPSEINQKDIGSAILPAVSNFYSFENYVQQQDFNFQLRGPPILSVSNLNNKAIKAKNE